MQYLFRSGYNMLYISSSVGKDQPSDVGKVAKKKTLRQEMETQLGNIMGDVSRF